MTIEELREPLEPRPATSVTRRTRVMCGLGVAALSGLLSLQSAPAQSSRAGMGSTPYADASGTGVTFRVWAPNATSVTVPGMLEEFKP